VRISNALVNIQHLYIETSPFIYYVENYPVYANKMDAIFEIVNTKPIEVITSVVTLAETLTKPLKTGDKTVEQAYRTLLQQTQNIALIPITAQIAERTADLRSRYNLRTPDALHIAAALDFGCGAFVTNDFALQRVKELPILILDDLEFDITP
jgi:predicted nucleic acid-binding protein